MKILAVDSSSKSASAALFEDDKLLAESFVNAGLTHSRTLMQMVENTANVADAGPADIDLLAVTVGPGSFTGLRIGIATVKGIAEAIKKPCAAVSTLEALAYNLLGFEGDVLCLLDARCGQFYTALFHSDGDSITRITQDDALSGEQIAELTASQSKTVYLVGDGAKLFYDTFGDKITDKKLVLCGERVRFVNSYSIAAAAYKKAQAGETCDASALKIEYLRLPQAERELKKKQSEG